MIVPWIHAETFYAPDSACWSCPGNKEIIGGWLVALFSGDFLIGLNNLPAAILLALAAVEVGRQLSLSSALANLTGFAVVSNYVVLNQLLDASNDVAAAALFVTCVAYGFRLAKNNEAGAFPNLLL